MRRKDLALDYLPTQYISDYVKSLGYDDIKYKSTLSEEGNNYAVFYDEKCKCINKKVFYIDNLSFQKKRL